MKILIFCLFLLLSYFAVYKFYFKNRYEVIYTLPIFFYIAFNFSFSEQIYRIVGEDLKYYINTATLIIIIFLIFIINKKTKSITWHYIFFMPLLLNIFLSIFSNKIEIFSFPMFVRVALNYFSIYVCYLIALSMRKYDLKKFLYAFNYLGIMNGVLGILQIISKKKLLIGDFNSSILYTEGLVDGNRAVGIAGSNNSAGNLAVLLYTISLYNLLTRKDVTSFFSCLLSVIFVMLTQTRIGILGIFVTTIIMVLGFKSSKKEFFLKKMIFFSFGIFGLVLGLLIFQNKLISVFVTNRGNTESYRFIQLDYALNTAISNHPYTGIGTGQWRSYLYNNYGIVDIPIHSQMVNFWAENGFIVFALFIIMNIIVLMQVIKNNFLSKKIKVFALAFFFGNFIVSNFNPNQIYTLNNIIFFLVMFLLAFYKFDKENPKL